VAGGEYVRYDHYVYDRGWAQGKAFARWGEWPDTDDGSKVELTLGKADNSTVAYKHVKIP
jgi:hypothetical protein